MGDRLSLVEPSPRRLTGTVKWFDPVKGFGFVVADDTGDHVLLHDNVASDAGLTDVRAGMRLECEVVRRPRGLQVVRVLSFVDAWAPPGIKPGHVAKAVTCEVKWSHTGQGVWYLWCAALSCDAVLALPVLRAAGYAGIPSGATLVCDVECAGTVFEVVRVRDVRIRNELVRVLPTNW